MNKPIGAIDGDEVDYKEIAIVLLRSALALRDLPFSYPNEVIAAKHNIIWAKEILWEEKSYTPSDQGEATRLREAMEKIVDVLADDTTITAQRINNIIITALSSSHREDGIQKAMEIRQFYADHNDFSASNAIEEVLHALGITIPGITEER